jgi:hypothetical protein
MKTNDPLDSLLESWQPKPPVPADFRQAVWTRIAAHAEAGPVVSGNFALRRSWMAATAAVVLGASVWAF